MCKRIGIGPKDALELFSEDRKIKNLQVLKSLIGAIAEFENYKGFVVPHSEFDEALTLL